MLWLFVKGIGAGIVLAAPVGPVGVLCIRRTLVAGRLMGLASGLGAALADAFFGLIAALGLGLIESWLLTHADGLRLTGGLLLIAMGLRALYHRPHAPERPEPLRRRAGLFRAFGSTLLLTLTNPVTLMAFLGIFAAIGLAPAAQSPLGAALLVGGVFAGSALWWLLLALGAGRLRPRLEAGGLRWINRLSGALLLLCGVYAWASLALG